MLELQNETNNYNYGFQEKSDAAKDIFNNNKHKLTEENCIVTKKNEKLVIHSDILCNFLKEHTYYDLLAILQIEPNNKEKRQIKKR